MGIILKTFLIKYYIMDYQEYKKRCRLTEETLLKKGFRPMKLNMHLYERDLSQHNTSLVASLNGNLWLKYYHDDINNADTSIWMGIYDEMQIQSFIDLFDSSNSKR